jgi:hypothetical protein
MGCAGSGAAQVFLAGRFHSLAGGFFVVSAPDEKGEGATHDGLRREAGGGGADAVPGECVGILRFIPSAHHLVKYFSGHFGADAARLQFLFEERAGRGPAGEALSHVGTSGTAVVKETQRSQLVEGNTDRFAGMSARQVLLDFAPGKVQSGEQLEGGVTRGPNRIGDHGRACAGLGSLWRGSTSHSSSSR